MKLKIQSLRVPAGVQQVKDPTSIHEDADLIPGLTQWGKGSSIAMSCSVGHRRGSDLTWPWLWCRLAAVAQIQPLVWEHPHVMVAPPTPPPPAKKKKREREEENKARKEEKEKKNSEAPSLWPYLKGSAARAFSGQGIEPQRTLPSLQKLFGLYCSELIVKPWWTVTFRWGVYPTAT